MKYNHNNYLDYTYPELKLNKYDVQLIEYLTKQFLLDKIGLNGEKPKLLDIGCGKGYQLLAFSNNFDVYGIDQGTSALELFEKNNLKLDLKNCDLECERLPYPDNTFDVIYTKSVVEHVQNTSFLLSETKRVLKKGGKLITLTPAWETQYINFYDDFTHIKPFTIHGLKGAVNSSGLKINYIKEFFQLPFLWKNRFLIIIPLILRLLPNSFKWKNNSRQDPNKLIRFSKETMILLCAEK
jgi:SAM-dependent methyltransferase